MSGKQQPLIAAQPSLKDLFNDLINTTFIPLAKLRPTQICVGMKEVEQKQARLSALENDQVGLSKYFVGHTIPVVLGPNRDAYIIDHHHLGLALLKEGYDAAPVEVTLDLSHLSKAKFWAEMERLEYVYPYDENGVQQPISAIPENLMLMKDDPYRSVAGFARTEGAFDKVSKPFSEYAWANYYRTRIAIELVTKCFAKAVKQAVKISHDPEAKDLAGYKPPEVAGRAAVRRAVKLSRRP